MASQAIEEAFSSTAKLLFGRSLSPIDAYAEWLVRDMPNWRVIRSGRGQAAAPHYGFFKYVPDAKIAAFEEFDEIGKKRLRPVGENPLSMATEFGNQVEYVVQVIEGANLDVEGSTLYKNLVNAYKCLGSFNSKAVGFLSWSDYNEHCFGLYRTFHSKSSMKCWHSDKLARCFEMDGCNNCSDAMFCHNCENLAHALFCFNSDGLRYAVGNVEVGKEKFEKIRGKMLAEIVNKLEKDKKLDWSIYNIGARGKP